MMISKSCISDQIYFETFPTKYLTVPNVLFLSTFQLFKMINCGILYNLSLLKHTKAIYSD